MSEPTAKKGFLNLIWLRDAVVVLILLSVALKFALTDFQIDLTGFSFTDLLALVMALFSILLSALFYFKASDDSTKFYNNSYTFTKEISELLGRIEAGFGEKLTNLHDSYTGLSGRLDNWPPLITEPGAVAEKEDIIVQKETLKREIFDEVFQRVQLPAAEREEFIKKIEVANNDLQDAKYELARLKEQEASSIISDEILLKLASIFNNESIEQGLSTQEKYLKVIHMLPNSYYTKLKSRNLIDSKNRLTIEAIKKIELFQSLIH